MRDSDIVPLENGRPRRRVSFDPTINLGHVLTFVGFMVAGFSAYSTLDKRQSVYEQQMTFVVENARAQEMRLNAALGELKTDMKELQRSVNDLSRNTSAVERMRP
ncbi:MAG: TMF family protein [Burkholderiales bacterium]|nr:TMF family protein [Burkholderiales bacterium]